MTQKQNKQGIDYEQIYVVSHTHWDREWYQDFQGFRTRLVYFIDELLDKMEQDPEYRYFMMDGQTIVLDDYLEIRPENKERLEALIKSGRIAIGPWYVMPDEFLVSGESLIRNFLKGYRQTRAYGVEPMKSGFVTDIFGHNSQFPQILKGFGMDNAVLFRGFRGEMDPSEKWWEGADGTRVLALKLDEDRAYGDFFFFIRWPFENRQFNYNREELIEKAKEMLAYKSERSTTNIALALDGVDHVEIEPKLPWILEQFNESDELTPKFVHTTLEHYLDDTKKKVNNLEVIKGEQRSPGYRGLNNMVLTNVLSSRIHLKQNNHHCETLLEKWAEPWGIFSSWEGRPYPKTFLAKSWEFLIQNHPHDSICGCSINQVHQDMMYRFDQSRLISEQMIKEELVYITNHLSTDKLIGDHAFTIFNPSQKTYDGVIDVELKVSPTTQNGEIGPAVGASSFKILDEHGQEVPYQLLSTSDGVEMFRPYRSIPGGRSFKRYQIAIEGTIPSFGYQTYFLQSVISRRPEFGEYGSEGMKAPVRYPGTMQVAPNVFDNGRIRLQVNNNGTINILDHKTGRHFENLLQFEDEADIGEGWNHVAPVTNQVYSSVGSQAQVSVTYSGPLSSTIRIQSTMRVPARIANGETTRSDELVDIAITSDVTLKKDDPIVQIQTKVNNTARDHRFKLILPTGLATDHFYTNTPFDLVKRDVKQPDYSSYMETASGVHPHQGIVALQDNENNGLALYSKGLYEATVRDDEMRTIALTLFRSTHKEVGTDGGDGGQLLRELTFNYAIRPTNDAIFDNNTLWTDYVQFTSGLKTVDRNVQNVIHEVPHRREATVPLSQSYVALDSSKLVITTIKQAEDQKDATIIRLFNPTNHDAEGKLTFVKPPQSVKAVDLDEQQLDEEVSLDGKEVQIKASPKQIITLKLT